MSKEPGFLRSRQKPEKSFTETPGKINLSKRNYLLNNSLLIFNMLALQQGRAQAYTPYTKYRGPGPDGGPGIGPRRKKI